MLNTLVHDRTIWTDSPLGNTAFIHDYMANSMRKDSPEMEQIRAAVKKAGIFVVLGYSERAGGSLYIAQVRRPIQSPHHGHSNLYLSSPSSPPPGKSSSTAAKSSPPTSSAPSGATGKPSP
jgi:hypothetical protein